MNKICAVFLQRIGYTYNREFIAGECAQNTCENIIVNTGCSSEVYLGPCQTFLWDPFGKKFSLLSNYFYRSTAL